MGCFIKMYGNLTGVLVLLNVRFVITKSKFDSASSGTYVL